jgi:hypothetical protein
MIRTAKHRIWRSAVIALAFLFVFAAAGCAGGKQADEHEHAGHLQGPDNFETTPSPDALPAFLDSYSPTTKDLYAKADAHADVLKELNCYCGCMEYNDPHDSLYRCFIAGKNGDEVTWTDHGAKCGICMMEIRDAVKMAEEGKSLDEIRAHIDSTYGGGA